MYRIAAKNSRDFFNSRRSGFTLFNILTNFAGGVNFTFGTHSMLAALTIDNPVATISSSFIMKDVMGQLGTVGFAYSKRFNKPDQNPVRFGTSVALLTQTCFLLENITPLFPNLFLPIAGVSNLGKNIGMIGMGSINVKCMNKIEEFSLKNKGDGGEGVATIYSKIAAHNSIASSLGMAFGVYLTMLFPDHCSRLYTIFPIISIFQIWTYRKSLKYLMK